jgi:hypothetical protein
VVITRRTIDSALTVAVVLACAVYGGTILNDHAELPQPPASVMPAAGTKLPALAGLPYDDVEATLLLFVRSTCHYCTASMPFYRSLVADAAVRRKRIRFVALGPEPLVTLRQYLVEQGLHLDSGRPNPANWSFVRGTPTVLIVNRDATLVGSFVGVLTPNDESQVRRWLQLGELVD